MFCFPVKRLNRIIANKRSIGQSGSVSPVENWSVSPPGNITYPDELNETRGDIWTELPE